MWNDNNKMVIMEFSHRSRRRRRRQSPTPLTFCMYKNPSIFYGKHNLYEHMSTVE